MELRRFSGFRDSTSLNPFYLQELYTVNCVLYYTLYQLLYSLYIIYCIYTVHCTLYTVHCTLYTVHCTLNFIHCTLYTIYCTLYSILLYTTTTLNTKYSGAWCTLQCCSILYMHWHWFTLSIISCAFSRSYRMSF